MRPIPALLDLLTRDPGDDVAWLALADALEENGDPRGEATRLSLWLRRRLDDPDHATWERRLRELVEQGVRVCLPEKSISLGNGVELRLVLVPPGSFAMGSPASETGRQKNETQHRVTLTKGFLLGVHPVTQAQWQAVMGSNPSHFKGTDLPVDSVSWDDCQEFCKKLTERKGQPSRLPTEAEWEYACRAGTTTPFHFGETISTDQANYKGASTSAKGKKGAYRQTTPVGNFNAPNAWGLHDMHGNVWEWCQDAYGSYPKSAIKDPLNHHGEGHVNRGGSWSRRPVDCRAACRRANAPDARLGYYGCRVVLCLD